MKRFIVSITIALAALVLVIGCTSAPAPAPTAAPAPKPAEPTKAAAPAAAPTAAPAAQPTAAPAAAAKVNWPEKGKTITLLQPSAAGGPNDIWARLFGSYMEKELGVSINVVPKPGASGQIGMTELSKAKPDGYTLGNNSLEQTIYTYLDKSRGATYDRKSFTPIFVGLYEPFGLVVPGKSQFKTVQDVIDYAKQNPEKLKIGNNGIGSPSNFGSIMFAKKAGIKVSHVNFNGSGEQVTAMLGGHIDGGTVLPSSSQAQFKSGDLRPLLVYDTQEISAFPNTRTASSIGLDVVMPRTLGWDGPAGLPKEIVDIVAAAAKKVDSNPEYLAKAAEAGMIVRHMELPEYMKHWDATEQRVKDLWDDIKAEEAKQPTAVPTAPTK